MIQDLVAKLVTSTHQRNSFRDTPNLRFTSKGSTLYAIALEKPTEEFVISMGDESSKRSVAQVALLGSDTPVKWRRDREGIRIFAPSQWPGEYAWTFKITMNAND